MSSPIEHTHDEHHHGGPPTYTRNLVALLILTAITVGASYIDFGTANVAIALAIASVKATLVALFFMHLRWDKPVNSIIGVAGFLFLGLLLLFTLLDVDTRRDASPRNIPVMTDKDAPTPVPESMNPLLTPPPKPLPAKQPAAEAEHGITQEH
jgi:cytochrome c oxidase subunit 4